MSRAIRNSTMSRAIPHIVRVDRRGAMSCPTLDGRHLGDLQAALRMQPWYSDRYGRKAFRQRVLEIMTSANAGIVLMGPNMSFEPPPPFDEFFEPIRLGQWDERMKVLSGAMPTRQEKMLKWLIPILAGLVALAVLIVVSLGILRGQSRAIALATTLMVGSILVVLIIASSRFGSDWYLLPAGVAIRNWWRRRVEPVSVLTPSSAAALLRWVSNGKSTMLVLELWRADGRSWRRAVSEREAISFLAAWRSDEATPTIDRLQELLGAQST